MKSAFQAILGLLIAALLLGFVLHGIDPNDLRTALVQTSWAALALGALINLSHNVFRVWRWRWLLDPVRPGVRFRPMFASVILGYMTTWVLPGRLGEVVRPALLSSKENIPLGPCMGTVVADRLLDGVAIVGLFAIGSLNASFSPSATAVAQEIRLGAWIALAVILVGLAALAAVSTAGPQADLWLSRRARPVRWAGQAALGVSRGAAALRSPRRLVPILAHSFAAWLTIGLGTWIGVRAAGAPVGFSDVLVMLLPLALGVAIPTPGGVGGYHAAMTFSLSTLFGVDHTVAVGAGIVMHLAIVLPVLILGPILLFSEKLSFANLVAVAKQVRTMGHAESIVRAVS
jgi:glycosyltransferase 2 family protein